MKITIRCEVNGTERVLEVHPMARALDVLREDALLCGTKEGCGEGECGACAVLIDGVLVNSCLVPALQIDGTKITTIETDHPDVARMQTAFIHGGGAQCGICTPGMILASVELLRRCPRPSDAQVREGLAGNLCRCTGYMKIIDSVRAASEQP